MMRLGEAEVNVRDEAAPLFVGRDWGRVEEREGKPFANPRGAGGILQEAMNIAGLRRQEINLTNVVNARPKNNIWEAHSWETVKAGKEALYDLIAELEPSVIVALGGKAANALSEEYPADQGIQMVRGFIFEYRYDEAIPVMATIHPAFAARMFVPWATLLGWDLQRAKMIHEEGWERPKRVVEVVW